MLEDINATGIGVVIRKESSVVLAALVKRIPRPESVLTLETLAARQAVQFIHEVRIQKSIFEGDYFHQCYSEQEFAAFFCW